MKKVLHDREQAFLCEKEGEIYPEEVSIEEVIAAINSRHEVAKKETGATGAVLQKLYDWIFRYVQEGPNEELLYELNIHLRPVQYYQYVVPPDFFSSEGEEPRCIQVANMNIPYTVETFAAKEVSRFITYGMLGRVKFCQFEECDNIFIGRPQAKWCSKKCGSNHRVRKKRKLDMS